MIKKALTVTVAFLVLSMLTSLSVGCIGAVSSVEPRNIPAIVSTDWLNANLNHKNLVVLDVRSPEAYNLGHIPGAINVPEAEWYILDPAPPFTDVLYMELPTDKVLFEMIGNAGITSGSRVVVVGSTTGPPNTPLNLYNTAGTTRVAITLLYAGVRNVAVLDGGYEKWANEKKPISMGSVTPKPVIYTGKGKLDKKMFVSIDYVEEKIGESIIVDSRDYDVYCGWVKEPWCKSAGHIPTAVNLPTPNLWNIGVNYITYKDVDTLNDMVSSVVGKNKNKEIIVYCGVGGYASTMYFVLSEVLGYPKVKFYDGSAQEWTHKDKPVETCPPPPP